MEHAPVLVEPILRLLAPQPGHLVLDGTVGLGGHALALLPAIQPGGQYIGLDVDEQMLAEAQRRIAASGFSATLRRANYADFPAVLSELGLAGVDVLLLDLGANSAQLADAARGFSFDRDGPLDMRYDRTQRRTALDLVNGLSERELADLFYEFGQEGLSRKIARRICQVRHEGRISTTHVLASAVQSAYQSAGGGEGRVNPATRVFQALRVAVNRELENLERCLTNVVAHLRPGGKLAVISFHSLEDAIVKRFLRQEAQVGNMKELTARPITADPAERHQNPRSRSAKLRVASRTTTAQQGG